MSHAINFCQRLMDASFSRERAEGQMPQETVLTISFPRMVLAAEKNVLQPQTAKWDQEDLGPCRKTAQSVCEYTCECKTQDITEKLFVPLLPCSGELLLLLPYRGGSGTQRHLSSVSCRNGPSTKLAFPKCMRSAHCPFLDSEPGPECPLGLALTAH